MRNYDHKSLVPNYPRCIAGFQLRVDPDVTPFSAPDRNIAGSWIDDRPVCLTTEALVWPLVGEDEDPRRNRSRNGWGMMDEISVLNQMMTAHLEPKLVVAFDIPEIFAQEWGRDLGVSSLPMTVVQDFEFKGYDVADTNGPCSGFYSFTWSKVEMESFLEKNNVKLNRMGLIDNEEEAIRLAAVFSEKFHEHGVFIPYGIWTHKSEGTNFLLRE